MVSEQKAYTFCGYTIKHPVVVRTVVCMYLCMLWVTLRALKACGKDRMGHFFYPVLFLACLARAMRKKAKLLLTPSLLLLLIKLI